MGIDNYSDYPEVYGIRGGPVDIMRASLIGARTVEQMPYYDGDAVSDSSYIALDFGFVCGTILFVNDGSSTLDVSYNGTDLHFEVYAGESLSVDRYHASGVWVKSASGSLAKRVKAW